MDYVKMPELLSTEAVKALVGNVGAIKNMMEVDSAAVRSKCIDGIETCCPKKVKFILILNNVAIFNINAVAEDALGPKKPV